MYFYHSVYKNFKYFVYFEKVRLPATGCKLFEVVLCFSNE